MSVTMDRMPTRTKTFNNVSTQGNTNIPRNNQPEKFNTNIRRNDIYMCDLNGNGGTVQLGIRPCLIISNSQGNRCSNIVVVLPISSSMTKAKLPTHVELLPENTGLV